MDTKRRDRGQGLVEMAVILPFLLVLVIGVVELGVVLNRQLVVVNAAREGARFGAVGASVDDIHEVVLSATSQMFEFDEDNTVVVVIKAETNDDVSAFAEWEVVTYPITATVPHVTRQQVLAALRGADGDVGLVIVDVEYDHEAVLGLPFVSALIGRIPIGSWTAMRQESLIIPDEPAFCVYPIALDVEDVADQMVDIQFGWLYWDPEVASDLEANLRDPCRVEDEFKDVCNPADTMLSVGDWVAGDMDTPIEIEMKGLVGRYIRIPLWDEFGPTGCRPGTQAAHIAGFAIIEVTETKLAGSLKTISARLVRYDEG